MKTPLLDVVEQQTTTNPKFCVIWLHGLGADGHDFADIVPQLDLPTTPGIRFVFPHAPLQPVTINGGMQMRAWYDITAPDLSLGEDEAGIQISEQHLTALIKAQNHLGIPTQRIILAGFSQGGAVALYTGLRYAQSLGGILALSAYLPLAAKLAQEKHAANQKVPILMAHGRQDPVVPYSFAEWSYQQLEKQDYSVLWRSYSMSHALCAEEIQEIRRFLLNVLDQQLSEKLE